MFDLHPGIAAALESTGAINTRSAAFGGFGLRAGFPWKTLITRGLRDSKPDVILAMWGGWDYRLPDLIGADGYQALLDQAITLMHSGGAHIVVVGQIPTRLGDGPPGALVPDTVDPFFRELPHRFPGIVTYVDLSAIIAPTGVPTLTMVSPSGQVERVRKIDLGHFCPAGAAHFAQAFLDMLTVPYRLPKPSRDWLEGGWRLEKRYDDPKGACTAVPAIADTPAASAG
jgi:hypothetical protein